MSQDKLLPGVLDFLAERVLASGRRELLARDLDARRARLLTALETTDDPHGVLVQDVNRRLGEIVAARHAKLTELQRLRTSHRPLPDGRPP